MSTLEEKFDQFHADNPHIAVELAELALRLHASGYDRYSIAGLFEVVRYNRAITAQAADGFKLNNNHRAFYARLIMERHPFLSEFFRTRDQTGRLA